jgi:hypothetical protein
MREMQEGLDSADRREYEQDNNLAPSTSKVAPVVVDPPKPAVVGNSNLQLMDVDNAEYRARREAALQKPGAVIGQATVR